MLPSALQPADLLAADNSGDIPRGRAIRGLDVGVGAACIYPLLGHAEYGWSFVGSDVDDDDDDAAHLWLKALHVKSFTERALSGLCGHKSRVNGR